MVVILYLIKVLILILLNNNDIESIFYQLFTFLRMVCSYPVPMSLLAYMSLSSYCFIRDKLQTRPHLCQSFLFNYDVFFMKIAFLSKYSNLLTFYDFLLFVFH